MKKICEFQNVSDGPFFYNNQLIICNKESDYLFFSTDDYSLVDKIHVEANYFVEVLNGQFFLYDHYHNDLYIYDDDLKKIVLYRNSLSGGFVTFFNEHFVEKKYDRNKNEVRVVFYKKNSEDVLWSKTYFDRSYFLDISEHLFLTNDSLKYIDFIDAESGEVRNTLHFENPPISRFIYYYEDTLIVSLQIRPLEEYILLGLDAMTGEEKWRLKSANNLYIQDSGSGYLYGISGNYFQVIDVRNGNMLVHENLSSEKEKYKIFFQGQGCLSPKGFYFKDNHLTCKFGLINLQTFKIEFVIDLNLPTGVKITDMSYHNGRLYVEDTNDTLHIFAEE